MCSSSRMTGQRYPTGDTRVSLRTERARLTASVGPGSDCPAVRMAVVIHFVPAVTWPRAGHQGGEGIGTPPCTRTGRDPGRDDLGEDPPPAGCPARRCPPTWHPSP